MARAAVTRERVVLWTVLLFFVAANALTWASVRDVKARWTNVPPAPGINAMRASALGDAQFAYRQVGVMLQNLGNTGGRFERLKDYDYNRLKGWFFLGNALDPRSSFIPYMASYYFGGVEDASKMPPLIDYLRVVGNEPEARNWRWMAQAVHLARYKLNDLNLAYELSVQLAANKDPTLPVWARQMPAFVLTAKGEKEAAYEILINLLKDEAETLPPEEVNATRDYICTRILDPGQAKSHPLCKDLK